MKKNEISDNIATDTAEKERAGGLMVCVTGQRACERLIERGAYMRKPNQRLFVVHCVQEGHAFLDYRSEPDAIEYLFTCASLIDAELAILRAENVVDALVDFAETNGVSQIILGTSLNQGPGSFTVRLASRLSAVDFIIVE
ncbi:MAG: universal stress protein UspA [Clostridia bacterium]|nr:universal stress protein UspA [Clostridia bacterium]